MVRHVLFAVYVAVCLLGLIWPGYAWLGNRIEPFVLGLPFSLAWVVGWVLLTFVILVGYHASGSSPEANAGRADRSRPDSHRPGS